MLETYIIGVILMAVFYALSVNRDKSGSLNIFTVICCFAWPIVLSGAFIYAIIKTYENRISTSDRVLRKGRKKD